MSAGGSTKVIFMALGANVGIAVSKGIAAAVTGSASMLAECIHSTSDCANQVLLLFGQRASARPANDRHPLGYGRETFFWSFIVAILLFSVGGLFAIYEGIHKLGSPSGVESPWIGITVLVIGIILEAFSFKACIDEVRAQNSFGSLWAWFRRTTAAELLVIFTEDAAALLGLVLALVCLVLAMLTGNADWDARGSILIGTLLVLVAALLAVEIKSLLIGEAPSTDYRPMLEELISTHVPKGRLLRLIALQAGGSEVLLSYKIHPGEVKDVGELISSINDLEAAVKRRFPEIRWQFVEPDNQA